MHTRTRRFGRVSDSFLVALAINVKHSRQCFAVASSDAQPRWARSQIYVRSAALARHYVPFLATFSVSSYRDPLAGAGRRQSTRLSGQLEHAESLMRLCGKP